MRRPLTAAALTVSAALLLTACSGGGGGGGGGADGEGGPDIVRPTTPTGVTAQAGSATSVHVMWERSTDDRAVTAYDVLHAGRRVATVPASRHMVDVERLAPSTPYRFTVRARDAAGNLSAPSAEAPVTTPPAVPDDRTPPTRPAALRGTADGSRAVTLTWSRATDATAVTAYDIHQGGVRVHSVPGTTTTTRLTTLRPGTRYTFTVRARDAADNVSPDSPPATLTTADAPAGGPATAPTGLTATARKGAVSLTWTPPDTGAPVKEHQLYLDGAFATTIVWGAAPPPGRAAYTFTVTDPPGTRHTVKLRARLPDGTWGDFSAERTVTVP
ncbi:fibronectin type III domain-containing protein [Streptomyces sp. NPDC015131]|uniref:fibronectin type III domain-containing protein n=1 Tax=Streptomyces sp. NPDC015131 TaxID=3364941 RepID=UPI0036F94A98